MTASMILSQRDAHFREHLRAIGKAIGYGNAQSILGELWDEMLVAEYGGGSGGRGQMGVTVDDALPPIPRSAAKRRQQLSHGGYQMVPAYSVEELKAFAHAAIAKTSEAEPLAKSDADYWLHHRSAILGAIEAAGFRLVSSAADGVVSFTLESTASSTPEPQQAADEREALAEAAKAAGFEIHETPNGMPFFLNVLPGDDDGLAHDRMAAALTPVAPWPDFAGNPIHAGDTIRHPSGETGVVEFWSPCQNVGDQWRVRYPDHGNQVSRLGLQIGQRGMAVVTPQCADGQPTAHRHTVRQPGPQ